MENGNESPQEIAIKKDLNVDKEIIWWVVLENDAYA